MTAQWNASIPALANQVANDWPDIEENFGWLKLLAQMNIGWKTSTIANVGPSIVTRRPRFIYTDGDTIQINPGGYFHDGTTRQWVFWDTGITFEAFRPGTGGSNASNSAASASAWHYIYIDDSAVVTNASPELVAACFINSTDAPAWSAAKHGWYNGSDRCIFAVLTDGSNAIVEFWHDGGDYIQWANAFSEAATIMPSTTWTDVDCASSVPVFCTKAQFSISQIYTNANATLMVRTNGQTGSTGLTACYVSATSTSDLTSMPVILDVAQIIEVKTDVASTNNVYVWVNGWYFPVGM